MSAYHYSFNTISGTPMPLAQFSGSVLLVVNTASACGYTGQYAGLEELYLKFKDQGLVVIGAPCDAFGGQEPGGNDEIATFCQKNYGVTFPLTEKLEVSGSNSHPFYVWAGDKAGLLGRPKWNFHKYLIGRDGAFIDWFSTPAKPMGPKITNAVKAALAAK